MERLQQLDTEAIPPTAQVVELHNVMREDEIVPSLSVEDVLANAPAREGDFFLVPAIQEAEPDL
jgi:aspartyl-tRNA(Asn)/glutamyl-tRNA(Gln) amidotransferase subunit C